MAFWKLEQAAAADPAAIEARSGQVWTYLELRRDADRFAAALPGTGRKSLGLILAQNCYECLVAWLAGLQSNSTIAILDRGINSTLLEQFLTTYRPDWIFVMSAEAPPPGYRASGGVPGLFEAKRSEALAVHPDLALLLSTSGSTGSSKMVRLTYRNIDANARSIAQYLDLTSDERPITSLPMGYSYGLSVINSHLHAGAAIVFSQDPVLRKEFWDAVDGHRCTSFAGVPYTYQALLSMGLLRTKGKGLKTLTQAGGRLQDRHIEEMYDIAAKSGRKFIVMYGQTEAAPRISYVPFESLKDKIGSIGIAIPNGTLTIDEQTGELIYSGPNVMSGYAECRADLAKGDELHGVLRTGDLARRDADEYFYITGRLQRFLKLFGKRFNLDEVERILAEQSRTPVACYGSDDLLVAAVEQPFNPEKLRRTACEIFDLPQGAVAVRGVKELPRNGNGKTDYKQLAAEMRSVLPEGPPR